MAKRHKAKSEENRARNRVKGSQNSDGVIRVQSSRERNARINQMHGPHFEQTTAPLSQSLGDVLKAAIEATR